MKSCCLKLYAHSSAEMCAPAKCDISQALEQLSPNVLLDQSKSNRVTAATHYNSHSNYSNNNEKL